MKHLNQTKKVIIESFGDEKSIRIINSPIPQMRDGQLLIHAAAAPINPLDLLKISGVIPNFKPPFTPGAECSGIVIEAKGSGLEHYIGKKVSASIKAYPHGAFSEYIVTNASDTIIMPDDVDLEQAACAFVNPLTALGLMDSVEDLGCQTFIASACNSALAKMFCKIALQKNLDIIGLVRGKEKYEHIKNNFNVKYPIDCTKENFEEDLKKLAKETKASVFLDCVAGPQAGNVLNCMPKFSTLINYGTLSGSPISNIDGTDLRFNAKSLKGFVFYDWLSGKNNEERQKLYGFVKDNLKTVFRTEIAHRIRIEDFKEGLQLYKSNMSGGKVLILLSNLIK